MEQNKACLTNTCSFAGIKPIMMDLPYPPIQVRRENPAYANLLGMDYCGPVSECPRLPSISTMKTAFLMKDAPWQRHFWESRLRK